jgi:hypothetical protein
MSVYYFPKDDAEFVGVVSYSPLDRMACPTTPFGDVCAEEYLEFARADLSRGDRAGLMNALGNAKKCFHYQTDRLLYRFGLRDATSRSEFPQKVELLRDLHIVSGTLLRTFNRERNIMEHDYLAPTPEIAEGSIDLCELFLLATQRYLQDTPARMRVVLADDPRDLILMLEAGGHRIQRSAVLGTTPEETQHGRIYKEPLFKLAQGKLADGLTVEALPDEDTPLRPETKETWLPILRMFAAAARESTDHPQYPDEPLVYIQHAVPWRLAREAFMAMEAPEEED